VSPGVPERQDGLLPTSWLIPAAPSVEVSGGAVLLNLDDVEQEVTVSTYGSNGLVEVGSSSRFTVPAASQRLIDLTDIGLLGRPVVISSSGRTIVERRVPSGDSFSNAWAIAGMPCC